MDGINKDGVKIRRKLDSDKRLPVIFSIRRAQIFFPQEFPILRISKPAGGCIRLKIFVC
jgi:hypothetical protein